MNEVSKHDLRIAAEELYHQARHKERRANTNPKERDTNMARASACRNVARVLREKAQ